MQNKKKLKPIYCTSKNSIKGAWVCAAKDSQHFPAIIFISGLLPETVSSAELY